MQFINILTVLASFLFAVPAFTAAIFRRDNSCTACLAMIDEAVAQVDGVPKYPQLFDCGTPDDQKKTIMLDDVCSTLTGTPLFGFCQGFVEAWSPAIYHYLAETSQNSTVVCSQPEFMGCHA